MLERRQNFWTWDAYLEWEAAQSVRYELVDGDVHAMGGGTAEHDGIANNLRITLAMALRGKPCRLHGPDLKVATGTGNARYPDALIDCGPRVPGALQAQEPAVVFEVLSKSTAWIDQGLKLRDYEATPAVRCYVLVSQDEPRILVYLRDQGGRLDIGNAMLLQGLDAVLALPVSDLLIPLRAIYDGPDLSST